LTYSFILYDIVTSSNQSVNTKCAYMILSADTWAINIRKAVTQH